MRSPTVVLILKAPRPGFVKTRLAAAIGAHAATQVYRRLVERQLAAVPGDWPVEIHHAPGTDEAAAELRAWLGPKAALFRQPEGDLGARLAAAAESALERDRARGGAGVLLIGGDCPGLDGETLRAAAAGLRAGGVVLGPATDGGYYLLGLGAPEPALFEGIPWSGPEVAAKTLERAAARGLTVARLPAKDDLDTAEDLRRHAALFPDLVIL